MTFETIKKKAGHWVETPVSVSCMKRQKIPIFVVRMRPSIMEALGVKIGSRLTAERGVGKDAKWLRLAPGDLSGFKITLSGKGAVSGYLSLTALSDSVRHRAAPTIHKFVDGALYVELPDWARAKTAKAT